MNSKHQVFLIGDQKHFHRCAAEHMAARGMSVNSYDAFATPDLILQEHVPDGSVVNVVFTPAELNEFVLLDEDLTAGSSQLCEAVGSRMRAFLGQAQAALKVLLRAGGGQLWVCDYDDSFGYHLDVEASPIVAQARAAAVRSLAKEYSRMKISVNALLIQPLAEGNEAKFKGVASLRSYAMRYKPSAVADVTDLLINFIDSKRLAFSGATIGTGMGVQQAHLIS
jgi:hypothetical protein